MRHPRIVISLEGMEGSGKTHFALSAPGPIRYLDFDYGLEGVMGGDAVDRTSYNLLVDLGSEAEQRRNAQETMKRFIADWRAAIGKYRTVVADTFTAAWAGQRLARSEDRYVEMEEEFKTLIRQAYDCTTTNVILIHHMRPEFKRDSGGKSYKSGAWSRDGMDGILNMVQLGIRMRYIPPTRIGQLETPGKFEQEIIKCRDNIGLMGQIFSGLDFPTLCTMAAPDVDWSK